jgi:hypothetical protein
MDLGIVVPAAVGVAVGLLRRRAWARKPMYAIVGAYLLLGTSVTGMGAAMWLTDDPDASATQLVGLAALTLALAAVSGYLYRPLLHHPRVATGPHPARPGTLAARR